MESLQVPTPASKSLILFEGDYTVRLEYSKDYAIVHLPHINKFTKSVYEDMKIKLPDWHDFLSTAGYNGIYAAVDPNNKKIIRLLTKLGFLFQAPSDGLFVFRYGAI